MSDTIKIESFEGRSIHVMPHQGGGEHWIVINSRFDEFQDYERITIHAASALALARALLPEGAAVVVDPAGLWALIDEYREYSDLSWDDLASVREKRAETRKQIRAALGLETE